MTTQKLQEDEMGLLEVDGFSYTDQDGVDLGASSESNRFKFRLMIRAGMAFGLLCLVAAFIKVNHWNSAYGTDYASSTEMMQKFAVTSTVPPAPDLTTEAPTGDTTEAGSTEAPGITGTAAVDTTEGGSTEAPTAVTPATAVVTTPQAPPVPAPNTAAQACKDDDSWKDSIHGDGTSGCNTPGGVAVNPEWCDLSDSLTYVGGAQYAAEVKQHCPVACKKCNQAPTPGPDTTEAPSPGPDTTESGSTEAPTTPAPEPGSTEGGSTEPGSIEAGSTEAGSTEAGSTEGGSTEAGSSQAGSTEAGSSEAPGTTEAAAGDTTEGGSTEAPGTTEAAAGDTTEGGSTEAPGGRRLN